MKTQRALFLVFAIMSSQAGADRARLEPNSEVQVAPDHSSILAQVTNSQSDDIYCDSVDLDIVRTGNDFNDFASHTHLHSGPLYIAQGKSVDLSVLGSSHVLAAQGVLSVASANIETASCRAANFAEYCELAEKTAEERHTTDMVLRTARRECGEAESVIGNSLNLPNQNLRSLRPIGFLKDLQWLDVSRNMIEDLSPLNALSVLRVLNISRNPVDDLRPVLQLISIRTVVANHTLVDSKIDPIAELRRRKVSVELRDTPFSNKQR